MDIAEHMERMERIAEIQANAMKWIVNIACFCIGYWMFSP